MRPEGLSPPSGTRDGRSAPYLCCVVEPHLTDLTSELRGLQDLEFSRGYQPLGTCSGQDRDGAGHRPRARWDGGADPSVGVHAAGTG